METRAAELTGAPDDDVSRSAARGFRYPGSPPFADTELDRLVFRGREVEIETILHSILSFDLLVVHGRSGIGKTSLLGAGVFQRLRDRDLWPVMLRLNDPDRTPIALIDEEIRVAADAASAVELLRHPAGREAPRSLWDLLSALEVWRGNTLLQPVLVFDQFEELFTLDWEETVRWELISGLGEIVRRRRSPATDGSTPDSPLPPPDVKIVLSLRADALGELEALSTDIPQILRNRVRILGLDEYQAARAIREPAATDDPRLRSARFQYTEEATATLLKFLRGGEERGETVLERRVDPSQLQVVCQHVERVLLPDKRPAGNGVAEITADDLGGLEGLSGIVDDFYRREVDSFDPEDRAKVKDLCETGLVSRAGRRLSLEEGEIEADFGVSRALLDALIDRRLVRAEPRVGSVYYELAHDTLVGPTMAHRRERQEREAGEREQLAHAAQLDRWAFSAGLVNALLGGSLGGFSMALPLLALRSPPLDRKGRWKRRFALGVGFIWMIIWVLNFLPPDGSLAQATLTNWILFVILVLQPALGVVVGALWPVRGATERPWGVIWSVGVATVALVGLGGGGLIRADPPPEPGAEGESLAADVTAGAYVPAVGDCADWEHESPDEGLLRPVGCQAEHELEVYAVLQLGQPADDYPGNDALEEEAQRTCLEEFEPYVGQPYESSIYDFSYIWPTDTGWSGGDRHGTCVVHLDVVVPKKDYSVRNSGE